MTVLCLAPNIAIASWLHTSLCIIIYTVYNTHRCFYYYYFACRTPRVSYLTIHPSHLCVVTISSFLRCQRSWSWAKLCLLRLHFQCAQRQFTQHCFTQRSSNIQLLEEEVKLFSDRRDDLKYDFPDINSTPGAFSCLAWEDFHNQFYVIFSSSLTVHVVTYCRLTQTQHAV